MCKRLSQYLMLGTAAVLLMGPCALGWGRDPVPAPNAPLGRTEKPAFHATPPASTVTADEPVTGVEALIKKAKLKYSRVENVNDKGQKTVTYNIPFRDGDGPLITVVATDMNLGKGGDGKPILFGELWCDLGPIKAAKSPADLSRAMNDANFHFNIGKVATDSQDAYFICEFALKGCDVPTFRLFTDTTYDMGLELPARLGLTPGKSRGNGSGTKSNSGAPRPQ